MYNIELGDMNRKQKYNFSLVVAIMLITSGGLLYIAFRPKSLMLFPLADSLHLTKVVDNIRETASTIQLPEFIVYCLPAGLWTASYLLIMFYLTRKCNKRTRLQLALPLSSSAVILEVAQLFSLCPGTFDIFDLVCYLVPITIFIIYA